MFRATALLVAIALFPAPADAIGLHWASGSTQMSYSGAVTCTLMVQSSPIEGRLPADWRLLWISSGAELRLVPFSGGSADVAEVTAFQGPVSNADSLIHLQTATFTGGGASPTTARYLMDLPDGAAGKIRLVALNPTDPDSSSVLTSNTVTFNGGCSAPFRPVILHVAHEHGSELLRVRGVGSGLTSLSSPTLLPRDGSRQIALALQTSDDTSFVAVGTLPDALPETELRATAGGTVLPCAVAPDVVIGADPASISSVSFTDPDGDVVPHDFAFVYNRVPFGTNVWRSLFHLIYTNTIKPGTPNAANSQKVLRHTWTSRPDIPGSWHTPVDAFSVSNVSGAFDQAQLYAPSIILYGGRYQMFYAGLNSNGEESIGLTSTALLDTTETVWQPSVQVLRPNPKFLGDPFVPGWVQPTLGVYKAAMRDPFVVEDPDLPGHLLMFYVAGNPSTPADTVPTSFRNAVGVVRSSTSLTDPWTDLGFFRRTASNIANTSNDESPHVFPDLAHADPGKTSGALWHLMFTDGPAGPDRSIRYTIAMGSVSDTSLDSWQSPVARLFDYLHQDQTVYGWEATEYLHVYPVDFLGAYDGSGIAITRIYWSGTDFVLGFPDVSVGNAGWRRHGVTLSISELAPGTGRVKFKIGVPIAASVCLTAFDVMGRRIRTIVDRVVPAGESSVTWDGRDEGGTSLRSGVYFARLSVNQESRVVRVPLVR